MKSNQPVLGLSTSKGFMIRPSIPEKKGVFTCDTNFGTQCRLFRSPKLFTLTTLISGIGIFDYLKWFCGYPIGYGLGQNLRQCLTSNGKLGTAIISVYCFNMLILGFTIMFFVSTSPLCNTGIRMTSLHNFKIVTVLFCFYR